MSRDLPLETMWWTQRASWLGLFVPRWVQCVFFSCPGEKAKPLPCCPPPIPCILRAAAAGATMEVAIPPVWRCQAYLGLHNFCWQWDRRWRTTAIFGGFHGAGLGGKNLPALAILQRTRADCVFGEEDAGRWSVCGCGEHGRCRPWRLGEWKNRMSVCCVCSISDGRFLRQQRDGHFLNFCIGFFSLLKENFCLMFYMAASDWFADRWCSLSAQPATPLLLFSCQTGSRQPVFQHQWDILWGQQERERETPSP